jgi:hypothetical protein
MTIRMLRLTKSFAVAGLMMSSCLAQPGRGQIEPQAGKWKTWVLASGDQFRLPPPPDSNSTAAELASLKPLLTTRNDIATQQVGYWDAGDPGYRWRNIHYVEVARRGLNNIIAILTSDVDISNRPDIHHSGAP